MMAVAADVLNIFVDEKDVLSPVAKGKGGLSRRQKKSLRALRAAELEAGEEQGYTAAHPALSLAELTIIPALEASAHQGVASRTLAKAYWVTADVLAKLAPEKLEPDAGPDAGRVKTAAIPVIRRLLAAGAEADPSEIRFPRALALSYGKELEFARMRRSLDAALALDPEDTETAAMAKWAEGHPRYRRALGLET